MIVLRMKMNGRSGEVIRVLSGSMCRRRGRLSRMENPGCWKRAVDDPRSVIEDAKERKKIKRHSFGV